MQSEKEFGGLIMNFRIFPIPNKVDYRSFFVGLDSQVPLANGTSTIGINFDNAATTPPLISVMDEIAQFAPHYSSIHRGAGYKSEISSQVYEQARLEVMKFVGGDLSSDQVIFVKNTTEGINKLSYRLIEKGKKDIILTTRMEHHSNLLPWREKYSVDTIEVDEQGRLRIDDLQSKLEKYQGAVKLVAVSGASNVTGHRNPIFRIARLAHRFGAKVCVDGAQLVPHAPIDMRPAHSPEHIDFLAFSAHKMYAPFGAGVLIGPKYVFEQGAPEYSGGGTARLVTSRRVIWENPPHREEAGTPNLMGIVALLAAIRTLNTLGMSQVQKVEEGLLEYALGKMQRIDGIKIYGEASTSQRIGVIPFNIVGLHHDDVAEILAQEGGIAVRSGCFCAQPYVQKLLRISDREVEKYALNPTLPRPGMVRVSLGLYNTYREIDVLITLLRKIVTQKALYMETYRRYAGGIY
jgi:cysteine desulfurase / selenocysteine lyase